MLKTEWTYIAALGMFEGKDETVWKDMLNPEHVETTADRPMTPLRRLWFRILRRECAKGKSYLYENDLAY